MSNRNYSIHQNAKGEITLLLHTREGEPDTPLFIFDNTSTALFHRDWANTIHIRQMTPKAIEALSKVGEIHIIEIAGNHTDREYTALVRMVRDVSKLFIPTT